MKTVNGGVCAPKGFVAGGIYSGIRKNPNKKDLALIYSKVPCAAAGVTTTNKVAAAPVKVTRANLLSGDAQAIICNSGNANACTPNQMEIAHNMCQLAAESLGISKEDVLVASTGVIGQAMSIDPIANSIGPLSDSLSSSGSDAAANAIMTTDMFKKEIAVTTEIGGKTVTIGGIAKGSGMIHPNMATMLGFITTDAAISPAMLSQMVKELSADTFNMISVDGDTSTNDMVLVLANGMAENPLVSSEDNGYDLLKSAMFEVFKHLAVAIAADGEGASKLLICNVTGAKTTADAKLLAKSVVKSSLLKAAMFGEDGNWGRVLCAMGYSGADFEPEDTSVSFSSPKGTVKVCEQGMELAFDEEKTSDILSEKEISINISLGEGSACATAWGCDLTYDYVKINGAYRS